LFYGEGVKGKRVSVPHIPDIQAQIIVQDSEIYSAAYASKQIRLRGLTHFFPKNISVD